MKSLIEISIPKDTVNDDEVLITDIMYADGDPVVQGDLLLVYESSKASVEIEATGNGFVAFPCREGDYVPIGNVVARITKAMTSTTPASDTKPEKPAAPAKTAPDPVFSKAAERYIAQKDLDSTLFAGRDLVNLEDVLELTGKTAKTDGRIPVVILGGGAHGLVLGDLLASNTSFRLKGYMDDALQRGDVVNGYPVLGPIPEITSQCRTGMLTVLVAVGLVNPDASLRTRIFDLAESSDALLPPFVHASANVDARASLGRGVQIHANATIGPDVILEDGVVVNTGAIISHHCRIGRHTHIAPGAILAGSVTVGCGCLVGMGVTAYLGISIGDNCVIENGTNLFKSVPAGTRLSNR
ncbi:MAG: hypothetical protein JEY79_16475 [Pseudodesulfovibrio sp.]|nr:hypothetical protein [Pseudodesulfovibrio sp.]